jgi:Zn-dependent protease
MAILSATLIRLLPLTVNMHYILINFIVINVVLGVFNLIPIPPLDGSRILAGLMPASISSAYERIEPYGFLILVLLIGLGILSSIVWPLVALILRFLGIYS